MYLLVDWSGYELVSRGVVYEIISLLEAERAPSFLIDCSKQDKKYFENWLDDHEKSIKELYFGGSGETLLIENGKVSDFIVNPGKLGFEKTKKKFEEWFSLI